MSVGVFFTHDTIRELRLALGLNLRQFAELFDVTEATASRWEAEDPEKRRHPTYQKMVRLNEVARKHGINFGQLVPA